MKFLLSLLICSLHYSISIAQKAALDFDGIDDYLELPASYCNFESSGSFTISFWLKIPSAPQPYLVYGDNDILEKWDQAEQKYPLVIRYINTTAGPEQGKIGVAVYDGTVNPNVHSTIPLNDDRWHHIAVTAQSRTFRLYIDGNLNASFYADSYNSTSNNSKLWIGRRGNGINYFKGQLDELRIRTVTLNASQIKQEMYGQMNNFSLQAAYSFEDGIPNADNTGLPNMDNFGNLAVMNSAQEFNGYL